MITLEELVAVDTESNGGGSFGKLIELHGISWADAQGSNYLECKVDPSNTEQVLWLQGEWEKILKGRVPVFHNAAHDIQVLRALGIPVPEYHCSMIMGYNLNPNMKVLQRTGMKPSKYGLDAWGVRLDMPKLEHPKWDEWRSSPNFYQELPVYAKRDAEICWGILDTLNVLQKLQKDEQAWDYYTNIDLPFIEVIVELNSTGLLIDFQVMEEWQYELEAVLDSLLLKMAPLVENLGSFAGNTSWHKVQHLERTDGKYTGEYKEDKGFKFVRHSEFNPSSTGHIKEAFKHLYGVELKNTQEDYLEEVHGQLPLTQLVLEYRKLLKLTQTYCQSFREKADEFGYVLAQFKQMCITGRLSCEKPNLQNLPSRDELGATFRRFIVAPPGFKIVLVDLSNIELRVMTALQAQSFMERRGFIPEDVQAIIDVFWNDPDTPEGDFHGTMTKLWFGLDHTHPDFKHMRNNVAKHITFARTYGAGIAKIAAQMKVDYTTAKQRKGLADKNNPSFGEFREWMLEEFEQSGGVGHTFLGRRLCYPSFNIDFETDEVQMLKNGEVITPDLIEWRYSKGERQAFNAKAGQGTAADILKVICVSILPYVWMLDARMVVQVHDELMFYVPEDRVQELMELLYVAVNRDDILPYVPVRGTPTYGDNWFDAKHTKENTYKHGK